MCIRDSINQLQATLSQGTVPSGNTGTLAALLSGIIHQIKALSGKSNWWDTPKNSFETLSAGGVVAGNVSNANAWWVKLGGAVPLIIQGGYGAGKSGSWAIAFPHALLGISGDYSGEGGAMDWGPSISGTTTGWSSGSCGSGLRVIAIGY